MHKLLETQLEQSRGADGTLDLEALTQRIAASYEAMEVERDAAVEQIARIAEERDAAQKHFEQQVSQRTLDLRASRPQLRLVARRMAAAIDSTGYAVSIFDAQKRLVYCNKQFLDLYHLPARLGRKGTSYATILRGRMAVNSIVGDDPERYFRDRMEGVGRGGFYSAVNRINTGESRIDLSYAAC